MLLRFTKPAETEFLRLTDIFLEYSGPLSADKFIERVRQCGEQLQRYPFSGHPEPLLAECELHYRSKSINENYRLIYYVSSTTIWIVDIWDRRRDPMKLAARIKSSK